MRSFLTALGIIIGVLSVTLMGTLISGLDKSFESSMSWLGKDILYVSRYEWFSDMEWWEVRNRPRMLPEYVDKIKERSQYAMAVAPVMQRGASISIGDKKTRTEIFGTNEEYMETISTKNLSSCLFISY
jgi:putative ABC transport system permease protein